MSLARWCAVGFAILLCFADLPDRRAIPCGLEKGNGGSIADLIPRPRVVKPNGSTIKVKDLGEKIGIEMKGLDEDQQSRVKESIAILDRRLKAVGGPATESVGEGKKGQIIIERCASDDLAKAFGELGVKEKIEPHRLDQGYFLTIRPPAEGTPIAIKASSVMGISYALVTLCQLTGKGEEGEPNLPVVTIGDWPTIGWRLAKTSASEYSRESLEDLCRWLALFKIDLVGLQYHGENSREPGRFTENVQAIGAWSRRHGSVEMVVYFCPFRGKGSRGGKGGVGGGAYDLTRAEDCKKCLDYFQWFLEQGARGIEIDYNDWSSLKPPIEEVINAVCKAVEEKRSDALMIYCPPMSGASQYRGPASAEMARILSKIPAKVRTLWTGPAPDRPVIEKPLTAADIKAWTATTNRKPFLWINQTYANGVFARKSTDAPSYEFFRGDLLPKDLDRYVEGIHLNVGLAKGDVKGGMYQSPKIFPLPDKPTPQTIAYLATAADYLWNPRDWNGEDSCRRARAFVAAMLPLLADAGQK